MDKSDFGENIEKSAEYIFNEYNNPLITKEIAMDLVSVIKNQLNYCNTLKSIIDYSTFLTAKQVESTFVEEISYYDADIPLEEKIDSIIKDQDDACLYKLKEDCYIFFNNTKE